MHGLKNALITVQRMVFYGGKSIVERALQGNQLGVYKLMGRYEPVLTDINTDYTV